MRRTGLGTVISAGLNIFLSLWLVNNYFYDEPFRNYVNLTFTQFYPFLILTLGVGGGSGLGYILLKKRRPEGPSARLQKTIRPLRQGGISVSPSGFSQVRGPGSVSPADTAKHTAYAVPPLQKSSPSGGPRVSPPSGFSMGSKPSMPGSLSTRRLEPGTGGMSQPSTTPSAPTEVKSDLARFPSAERAQEARFEPPPSTPRTVENVSRIPPPAQWPTERTSPPPRSEQPGPYLKPGLDLPPRTDFTPSQSPGQGPQSPAFPSKWQPAESTGKPPSWVNPVPKPSYSPPPRLAPPGSSPPSGPGPSQGPVPRPGPFPPARSPFGQPQPPPRPLTFPGAMRPPEPRPGQRPVGPGQSRPPPMMGPPLQRPPVPGERQALGTASASSPSGIPLPTGQSQGSTASERPAGTTQGAEPPQSTGSQLQHSEEPSPTGEMDWDTALDTILKTLRKDKLTEK